MERGWPHSLLAVAVRVAAVGMLLVVPSVVGAELVKGVVAYADPGCPVLVIRTSMGYITEGAVRQMIRRGQLLAIRVGPAVRIPRDVLETAVRQRL